MKRKHILLTYLFCCLFVAGNLSGAEIKFEYDDAGNRTSRKIIRISNSNLRSAVAIQEENEETVEEPQIFTDHLSQSTILIYPNPTKGLLKIEINGGINPVDLQLYDMSGRLLQQESNVASSVTLDLSRLPAGTYILRLVSGNQKNEWKIIKE